MTNTYIGRIIAFFVGLFSNLLKDVVLKILPFGENLRFKIQYEFKKFWKWVRDIPIEVVYTMKTKEIENPQEDLLDIIREKLIQDDFQFLEKSGNSLIFQLTYEENKVITKINPSYSKIEENGEEKLIISFIQADLVPTKCSYRDFHGYIEDVLQTVISLTNSLIGLIGVWSSESLSCKLSKLYHFTGALSKLELSSLSGRVAGKYQIDLSEKGITIYGHAVRGLTSTLKKIITYYY